tara:strand:+ start:1800 stop:2423 length:624 start_codon:yes stop_codon:yes gene_type:complete
MSEKDIYNNKIEEIKGKVVRNTIANTRDMALKHPKGEDGLTDKQRIFVEIYTKEGGRLTPTECARQAGYKNERAATTASELLNVKKYPRVVAAVQRKRSELHETHKVEMNKHVVELARLRDRALADKSHSAAINAERLRGQAAGLYVERKEIRTGSIDSMSRDEVISKLREIGLDGSFKKKNGKESFEVTDSKMVDITDTQTENKEE